MARSKCVSLLVALALSLVGCDRATPSRSIDAAVGDAAVGDASVDADTVGDEDGGGDAAVIVDGGDDTVWIGNAPRGCEPTSVLAPALDDPGQLVAATLTPASTPVTVDRIGYSVLGMGDVCSGGTAHRVHLYVTTDGRPPANDEDAIALIDVEQSDSHLGFRRYQHALAEPITLQEGETLILAISMSVDAAGTGAICPATCGDDAEPGEGWMSDRADAPRTWSDLTASSDGRLMFWASGSSS